ncbi:hypothetical protein VKT23_017455 [Stygiomarasmius scandens]|uniref:Uncharacterized protein n=1 Tax=Marasmiellus scandens TaxID=2682957 RepID=A0ABR1IW79_9AGAR
MSATTLYSPPNLSFDNLSRVDASARFGFSSPSSFTASFPSVLVSLSGPIAPTLSQEKPNKSTLEVHVRPLSNVPGTQEKFFANILGSILECAIIGSANPRTVLQFVVQVLVPQAKYTGFRGNWQRDKLLASMVNASTLALLNASSIPMRGMLCAVSVGKSREGSFVVDMDDAQSETASAFGCFSFLFSGTTGSACVWTNWRSIEDGIDESELDVVKVLALEGARDVWMKMKELVGKREGLGLPEEEKNQMDVKEEKGVIDDDKMEI